MILWKKVTPKMIEWLGKHELLRGRVLFATKRWVVFVARLRPRPGG